MTFAVIAIQGQQGRLFTRWYMTRPISGVDEQQILGAVIIEIEKGHPPSHRFREQFIAVSAIVVNESDSGFLRDVAKMGEGDVVCVFRLGQDKHSGHAAKQSDLDSISHSETSGLDSVAGYQNPVRRDNTMRVERISILGGRNAFINSPFHRRAESRLIAGNRFSASPKSSWVFMKALLAKAFLIRPVCSKKRRCAS